MGNIAILCSGCDDISNENYAGGIVSSRNITKMYAVGTGTEGRDG